MNKHVDNAYSMLNAIAPADTLEGVSVVLHAQAEATLALAYEQRTANLIAVIDELPLPDAAYGQLLEHLKERLGLS